MDEITNKNDTLAHSQVDKCWIFWTYFEHRLRGLSQNFKVYSSGVNTTRRIFHFSYVTHTLGVATKRWDKNNKTCVMKTILDDEKGGHAIKRLECFPKELYMYGKFLPAFEKLYRDAGKTVQLGPVVHFQSRRRTE